MVGELVCYTAVERRFLSRVRMRAVLAFPPLVSPTYVPLALATLAPHIRREAPSCSLDVVDLNISLWNDVAEASAAGLALRDFLQGRAGDFYDSIAYEAALPTWRRLRGELEALAHGVRRYLESGEGPSTAIDALIARVLASDPELVGLSITFPGQLLFALALARGVAKHSPRTRVVLGGASLSAVDANELLALVPEVDSVLLGEGEPGAGLLFAGAMADLIPGLMHRVGSGLQRNKKTPVTALSGLPSADFRELDLARYFNPTPVLPVVASRGCPWRRCRFCSHNFSFGSFRSKEAACVVEELAGHQARHGAWHFYFAEEDLSAGRLGALATALTERDLGLSFHAIARPSADFDVTAGALDEAYWPALFNAGCHWISWGAESGAQRLLELVLKGTRVETIERVLSQSHAAGISNLLMLIFGLPSSTDEDLAETLDFIGRVYPTVDAISGGAFVLFAGTPFARQALRHGLHILGAQPLLQGPAGLLSSTRLSFKEISTDGSLRPSRGAQEVDSWRQRRAWLAAPHFVESLCAEHYLLYVSHRAQQATPTLLTPRAA